MIQDATDIKGGRNAGGAQRAERAIVTSQIGKCCEPSPCDKTRAGGSDAPDRIRSLGTAGAMARAGRRATEGEVEVSAGGEDPKGWRREPRSQVERGESGSDGSIEQRN
jgi:hypothetical protein